MTCIDETLKHVRYWNFVLIYRLSFYGQSYLDCEYQIAGSLFAFRMKCYVFSLKYFLKFGHLLDLLFEIIWLSICLLLCFSTTFAKQIKLCSLSCLLQYLFFSCEMDIVLLFLFIIWKYQTSFSFLIILYGLSNSFLFLLTIN